MARAILLIDNGNERDYRISNGETITIKISDDAEITYWNNSNQIGNDEDFVFIEDEFTLNRYLLARMYVPIKNSGLGRATVEYFKEYYEADIYVRPNDGIEREDGSHLTEDAPSFVFHMIKEGLIEDNCEKENFEEEY